MRRRAGRGTLRLPSFRVSRGRAPEMKEAANRGGLFLRGFKSKRYRMVDATRQLMTCGRHHLVALLLRSAAGRRDVRSLRADMSVLCAWHIVAGFTRHFLSPTDSPSRLSTRTAQSRPAAA